MTSDTFKRFSEYIESTVGIRMPQTKEVMLEARLSKRVRALGFSTHEEYCDYVFSPEGHDREIQQLIDVVTTNETEFFREAKHYSLLSERVLPELVGDARSIDLNLWSVAASTGQEAYTLAIIVEEFSRAQNVKINYRILGTDISEKVLRVAETGVYTERQASKIPSEYKRRYFLKSKNPAEETVRVRPEIRSKVVFRKLNLMDDLYPVTKKYHIVFCRNVFIYFDRETQHKVLARIYSHIIPGGFLFMGHSENIGRSDLPLVSIASAVYRKENRT